MLMWNNKFANVDPTTSLPFSRRTAQPNTTLQIRHVVAPGETQNMMTKNKSNRTKEKKHSGEL